MTSPGLPVVDLTRIENICWQLYEATEPATRAASEAAMKFEPTNEAVQRCEYLLSNSHSPYAQVCQNPQV